MNAIYLCAMAQPWIEVSKQLERNFNIHPSYFVIWAGDEKQYKKSNLKNSHLQTLESAWRGEGFPKNIDRHVFDEPTLQSIAQYELTALKMMDRLDPDGQSFAFETRLYFFRDLLGYWFNVVKDRDIELVISPSIPHRVFDYALYVVCQMLNIKFVMFQLTPFGSNSILIDDINTMPPLTDSSATAASLSKQIQDKINRVNQDYGNAIPDYMVRHATNDTTNYAMLPLKITKKMVTSPRRLLSKPNTYWVQNGLMPKDSDYSWRNFQKTVQKRARIVKALKNDYHKITTDTIPNDFILVALHYQPEETSCPTGGSYSDQILMIQLLNQYLPNNVTILIKEHKSQFYTHQESASGRSPVFYDRISKVSDRIQFVSESADPFELIDRAQAVVTISGTIGWESAVRGTPVLIFGRAWYEQMPRVLKVKSADELVSALSAIKMLKNKDLTDEINDFHMKLEQNFIKAKHYKTYVNNDDVTMTESVSNITKGLSTFLALKK